MNFTEYGLEMTAAFDHLQDDIANAYQTYQERMRKAKAAFHGEDVEKRASIEEDYGRTMR